MNKKNNSNNYTDEGDKIINANYYWSDEQLRVMRGLNIPIWYTPVLKTVTTMPVAYKSNNKIEIIQHNTKIANEKIPNEKDYLTKKNILDDYKILNLNNSTITDYINFNDISNSINNSLNNYLFIINPVNKDSIDSIDNASNLDNKNINNNESTIKDSKFFIDNIDYNLLYNIADSLKWILNKRGNKNNKQGNKQENNYFVMPVQFNLNKITATLKPKAICVMGQSLTHYFENDSHYLLKKITKNDIKNDINIQDELSIYHCNGIPLLFINSIDEVRNNLVLKSNVWFMLNYFFTYIV